MVNCSSFSYRAVFPNSKMGERLRGLLHALEEQLKIQIEILHNPSSRAVRMLALSSQGQSHVRGSVPGAIVVLLRRPPRNLSTLTSPCPHRVPADLSAMWNSPGACDPGVSHSSQCQLASPRSLQQLDPRAPGRTVSNRWPYSRALPATDLSTLT